MNGGVSEEKIVFLENNKNSSIQKTLAEKRRKLLKAVMDTAILSEMTNRSAMGVPEIITFFKKKYSIQLSAVTIYPVIRKLEKNGHIKRIPRRKKKTYVLTPSGEETLKRMQQKLDSFQMNC